MTLNLTYTLNFKSKIHEQSILTESYELIDYDFVCISNRILPYCIVGETQYVPKELGDVW